MSKRQTRLASAGALLERLLHDLKQPLNQIRVVAQDVRIDMRKDRLELDSLPESMGEIEKAVDQLALHIDRFRVFARQPGEPSSEIENVNEICSAVIESARSAYREVGISKTLAQKLPSAAIVATDLEQALWQILDNAAQAAESGGRSPARVEVSTHQRGRDCVIAVGDNGRGVSEQDRSRIFEPFFTTHQEAAGLGLPLAAQLVGRVGGSIRLQASDEEGSRFEIVLPTF